MDITEIQDRCAELANMCDELAWDIEQVSVIAGQAAYQEAANLHDAAAMMSRVERKRSSR